MGQYWVIANVDARQTTSGAGGKLGESFWTSKTNLTELLMKHWSGDIDFSNIWADKEIAVLESAKPSPTSRIVRLPNELLRMIFDAINDLMSCIFLCVTHNILGVAGEARLRELAVPEPGPWAGHRILCVGDYCRKFPASVEEEISAQAATYTYLVYGEDSDASDTQEEDASFYECVSETYKSVRPSDRWPLKLSKAQYKLLSRLLSSADRKRVNTVFMAIRNADIRLDIYAKDLVLCNLSKGEYVRNDACVGPNTDDSNDSSEVDTYLDLGLVLFSRICWSTTSHCSMPENISDRLTTGTWAGDRFEIIPREKMGRDIEWKDITEEAIAWLHEIFESEHQ
ncbi:uncharacterized protein PHACADRAFT_209596 [Phanerochaete carnosa HHB-10118-sp]|uniref:Uncharacterized protein n=1 Tax=Phanerochaete carnosa (strain HHB-10118-sp) TaxID=650164 RepID=K5WAT0_PHACS|nr:uncharacterized protein PHACADRAFT_209596 [Phanerochaete carnosa HHB-10118-sp]EKM56099.1 hypothetical protein PHACADRAFT_209596 [Phanerochaete carnosa HHB-10118-sp]